MNKTAWLFPGQGAQFPGMGRDIYNSFSESRQVFEEADEVMGFPLSELCFEGPAKLLVDTSNAQPATFAMSIACLKAIEGKTNQSPSFVAGHSLGEYTALVAAGVVSFTDGLLLVRERGRLMRDAPQTQPEGMAAIIGLESGAVEEICWRAESCLPGSHVRVVNFNSPMQLVVSGSLDAVRLCIKMAEESGAMMVKLLAVSRAFHSIFMRPVAGELKKVLSQAKFKDAKVPVVSNINARPMSGAEEIRAELADQVFSPVQWTRSIEYMLTAGVSSYTELGPGRVLTGLVKNIAGGVPLSLTNLSSEKSITSYLSEHSQGLQYGDQGELAWQTGVS